MMLKSTRLINLYKIIPILSLFMLFGCMDYEAAVNEERSDFKEFEARMQWYIDTTHGEFDAYKKVQDKYCNPGRNFDAETCARTKSRLDDIQRDLAWMHSEIRRKREVRNENISNLRQEEAQSYERTEFAVSVLQAAVIAYAGANSSNGNPNCELAGDYAQRTGSNPCTRG